MGAKDCGAAVHPELFTIPGIQYSVKSYGFCVMLGFLTAAWFAMRRAVRVKADPDLVLNISFVGLVAGLLGSRVFYVIHYWESQFAGSANKIAAILDISQGGFEFLGSVIGAVPAVTAYLWWKKESIRVYLDILAPGLMWGLAFGRVGCFLNGCCFGGPCEEAWAVRFPYGSPAFVHQWNQRQVTVPAELVLTAKDQPLATLVPAAALRAPLEKLQSAVAAATAIEQEVRAIDTQLRLAEHDKLEEEDIRKLKQRRDQLVAQAKKIRPPEEAVVLHRAQMLPSREHPERFSVAEGFPANTARTSLTELADLAAGLRSVPVHPVQLYAAINAMILSGVLSSIFYLRRRHGTVFGWMLVLYPVARVMEEIIRADNPRDTAGLTISQFTGLLILAVGAGYLVVVYRFLPRLSPYARAFVPPKPDESGAA